MNQLNEISRFLQGAETDLYRITSDQWFDEAEMKALERERYQPTPAQRKPAPTPVRRKKKNRARMAAKSRSKNR